MAPKEKRADTRIASSSLSGEASRADAIHGVSEGRLASDHAPRKGGPDLSIVGLSSKQPARQLARTSGLGIWTPLVWKVPHVG